MSQHRRFYLSTFILSCFLLALISSQNSTIRWIDAQMFRVASYLLPVPEQSNHLRVIHLSEARLQKPDGIKAFRQLLRKLRKSAAAEIVWLTDDFPQMDYAEERLEAMQEKTQEKMQEKMQEKVGQTSLNAPAEKNMVWKPTKGERNKLAWMLDKQNVFLTQYNRLPREFKTIAYSENLFFEDGWRQYIPTLFLPQLNTYSETQEKLPYRIYPFNFQASGSRPLVWYAEDKKSSVPDLSLAVFSRYQNNQQLNWAETGVASLDQVKLKAGLTGQVFDYFSELTNRHASANFLSLQSAEKKSAEYYKNKIILIGQNKQQLQALVDSISSINSTAIYYTPTYSWWLLAVFMLVIVIYLLWLLPLLSKQSGVFLGAFIVLALISVQPVLLILKGMWWPSINLLLLLALGHFHIGHHQCFLRLSRYKCGGGNICTSSRKTTN